MALRGKLFLAGAPCRYGLARPSRLIVLFGNAAATLIAMMVAALVYLIGSSSSGP